MKERHIIKNLSCVKNTSQWRVAMCVCIFLVSILLCCSITDNCRNRSVLLFLERSSLETKVFLHFLGFTCRHYSKRPRVAGCFFFPSLVIAIEFIQEQFHYASATLNWVLIVDNKDAVQMTLSILDQHLTYPLHWNLHLGSPLKMHFLQGNVWIDCAFAEELYRFSSFYFSFSFLSLFYLSFTALSHLIWKRKAIEDLWAIQQLLKNLHAKG